MEKIRTLIVDDEPVVRQRVRSLLEDGGEMEGVGECGDGLEAVSVIRSYLPRLLFLDTELPTLDGFGVLQALDPGEVPAVVFMTPFRRRTLLTFEAHGLDYLVKPVDRHRLIEAVNGVKARLRAGAAGAIDPSSLARLRDLAAEPAPLGRIRVATRGRVVLVPTAQIDWIDGRGNYAILHLGQETACASASRRSRRGSIRCASCASTDRGS